MSLESSPFLPFPTGLYANSGHHCLQSALLQELPTCPLPIYFSHCKVKIPLKSPHSTPSPSVSLESTPVPLTWFRDHGRASALSSACFFSSSAWPNYSWAQLSPPSCQRPGSHAHTAPCSTLHWPVCLWSEGKGCIAYHHPHCLTKCP